MIVTRRWAMKAGGGILAGLLVPAAGAASDIVEIVMQGNADGSRVWFNPVGIHIRPGQTVRWTNRDPGNSHTTTAYHPDIYDRPLRIPATAKPWDSDYLLPEESYSHVLREEGVYDYYCLPHEHAGMVGRIVVGDPGSLEIPAAHAKEGLTPLPDAALEAFPTVEEILAKGVVRRG